MKAIFLSLPLLLFTLSVRAESVPALVIPLDLSRSGIKPEDLKVTYEVHCQPRCRSLNQKDNILEPTPPVPGIASVSRQGVIETMPVDLASFPTPSLDSAVVQMRITLAGEPVFSIYAADRAKIAMLSSHVIYVLRIEEAALNLLLKGRNLFGGSEAKANRAILLFGAFGDEPRPDVSGSPGYLSSLEKLNNLNYDNRLNDPNSLANLKTLPPMPTDYYASIKPPLGQTFHFSVYFGTGERDFGNAKKDVPLGADALQRLQSLDLK